MTARKKRGAKKAPRPRSGFVTEEQRNTERLTLRLPPAEMEILRDAAAEHGWTAAETVRQALRSLQRELDAELRTPHPLPQGAKDR